MLNYNYYMSCHMALLRGLMRGLASHCGYDASPRFISSCCAFGARNVYAYAKGFKKTCHLQQKASLMFFHQKGFLFS